LAQTLDDTFGKQKEAFLYLQDGLSTGLTKSSLIPDSVTRLKLHATTGYSIKRNSKMTSQPVSDGSNRADHYTNNLASITLSGVIADQINPFRLNRKEKTSQEYVEEIMRMQSTKQRITVVLPQIGFFSNCMITNFTPTRRTGTGLGTEVSITLQRILVATLGTTRKVRVLDNDLTAEESINSTIDVNGGDLPVYTNAQSLENEEIIADNFARAIEESKLPEGG